MRPKHILATLVFLGVCVASGGAGSESLELAGLSSRPSPRNSGPQESSEGASTPSIPDAPRADAQVRARAIAAEASTRANGLRLVVISDLNSAYGSADYSPAVEAAAKAVVERIRPDLVLITGDMVAGQKRGLDYRAMWEGFHEVVTGPLLTAGIPVAPAPGNHDAAPGFAVERAEYVAQWTQPGKIAPVRYIDDSNYPLYYSFEHGGVFFAAVDATAVGPLRGNQHAWLDEQLSASDADIQIVFGHLPNHPIARKRQREILGDDELDAILRRHRVDAYISGHHHAYYPGAIDGVRHVAMPCLGSGARPLIGRSKSSVPALLVVELDADGIRSLEALRAPDFDGVIDRKTLPRHIQYGSHAIIRDDLAWPDVDQTRDPFALAEG